VTSSSTAIENPAAPEGNLIPAGRIDSHIFLVRGQKILLDRHLAELYGTTTRLINQAVQRNRERFPEDFMFPLTREEIMRISQIETSSGLKYSKSVNAFTEQGVAMLSGLLNSPRAIAVNVEIMRAFVRLRQMIASHSDLARKLSALEKKYDEQFKAVFDAIRQLMEPIEDYAPLHNREIGFHATLMKPKRGRGKKKS
jgi:hypothetical protein